MTLLATVGLDLVQSYQRSSVDPTQHNSGLYCDILYDEPGVMLDAAFGGQDPGDALQFYTPS